MNFLFKKAKIRLYRSCSDLPIYNFHKMMETGNYSYLSMHWDEFSGIKINEDEAKSVWGGIYNEYCKLTNNNKAIMFYKDTHRLSFLMLKKEVGSRIFAQISLRELKPEILKEYLSALRDLGFKYKGDLKTINGLENLQRQIRALDNQIGILSSSIEQIKKEQEFTPFSKELVLVEQALGRNEINPRNTSVEKWVYMIAEIKRMNEERRKQALKPTNGR